MFPKILILCGMFAALLVCDPALGGQTVSTGVASWYGARHEGRRTSSGCRFHAAALTAASPTLPMGMMLRLSRADHTVVVQINDRGPYVRPRVLDLSRGAAEQLDMLRLGVARVTIERLGVKPLLCR